jgi:transposase
MVAVDEYARIRLGHRDGLSIRQLAQRFHHSRRKIREILATPEPKSYKRLKAPPSILDPFQPIIDSILAEDEQAPRKQRHTAAKLFRRLRQEFGYSGGYDRVRRHLRSRVERQREVVIPLDHELGQRLECDFGHIAVDFPEGRRQVPVLVVTWSWSNCPFAIALPTERTEAILHGTSEALAFFPAHAIMRAGRD